jgi:hypothetical protein
MPYLIRAFAHVQQFAGQKKALPQEVTVLKPLDQGVEDRSPLDTSLRRVEISMSVPSGFRDAFAVPEDDRIMRIDGALAAVFESSTYSQTQQGISVDVPPATIWVIDGAPLGAEPGHGTLLPVDPLSPGAFLRREFIGLAPPVARASGGDIGYGRMSLSTWQTVKNESQDPPSGVFLTDQAYRRECLGALVALVEQAVDRSP